MTITATIGVPTTSWILMADSHKLSFSTMKTYLLEKPPYGICIGLGQLDLSKLFEKWTPLLLQGDPNQNLKFVLAITLKTLLVKPKCV